MLLKKCNFTVTLNTFLVALGGDGPKIFDDISLLFSLSLNVLNTDSVRLLGPTMQQCDCCYDPQNTLAS